MSGYVAGSARRPPEKPLPSWLDVESLKGAVEEPLVKTASGNFTFPTRERSLIQRMEAFQMETYAPPARTQDHMAINRIADNLGKFASKNGMINAQTRFRSKESNNDRHRITFDIYYVDVNGRRAVASADVFVEGEEVILPDYFTTNAGQMVPFQREAIKKLAQGQVFDKPRGGKPANWHRENQKVKGLKIDHGPYSPIHAKASRVTVDGVSMEDGDIQPLIPKDDREGTGIKGQTDSDPDYSQVETVYKEPEHSSSHVNIDGEYVYGPKPAKPRIMSSYTPLDKSDLDVRYSNRQRGKVNDMAAAFVGIDGNPVEPGMTARYYADLTYFPQYAHLHGEEAMVIDKNKNFRLLQFPDGSQEWIPVSHLQGLDIMGQQDPLGAGDMMGGGVPRQEGAGLHGGSRLRGIF